MEVARDTDGRERWGVLVWSWDVGLGRGVDVKGSVEGSLVGVGIMRRRDCSGATTAVVVVEEVDAVLKVVLFPLKSAWTDEGASVVDVKVVIALGVNSVASGLKVKFRREDRGERFRWSDEE